jgi:hypothetical protein
MTEAEMDSELDRIEAEEKAMGWGANEQHDEPHGGHEEFEPIAEERERMNLASADAAKETDDSTDGSAESGQETAKKTTKKAVKKAAKKSRKKPGKKTDKDQ